MVIKCKGIILSSTSEWAWAQKFPNLHDPLLMKSLQYFFL